MFIPVAPEHHYVAFKRTSQSEVPEMPTLDSTSSGYNTLVEICTAVTMDMSPSRNKCFFI